MLRLCRVQGMFVETSRSVALRMTAPQGAKHSILTVLDIIYVLLSTSDPRFDTRAARALVTGRQTFYSITS